MYDRDFYPRPPGGGRRRGLPRRANRRRISIHALRVEGDSSNFSSRLVCKDFYPRPPGGGRRENAFHKVDHTLFLSTPSGWRATNIVQDCRAVSVISIHALRVEGDELQTRNYTDKDDFYPRPPGGGRPILSSLSTRQKEFLSTPSGWRATIHTQRQVPASPFLSTPSGWRATASPRRWHT